MDTKVTKVVNENTFYQLFQQKCVRTEKARKNCLVKILAKHKMGKLKYTLFRSCVCWTLGYDTD